MDRALELVSPSARNRELKLADLETHKQDILQLREKLQSEIQQANGNKGRYLELVEKFKRERDEWMTKIVRKGEDQLQALMAELKSSRVAA